MDPDPDPQHCLQVTEPEVFDSVAKLFFNVFCQLQSNCDCIIVVLLTGDGACDAEQNVFSKLLVNCDCIIFVLLTGD